jgi:membrane associated rhomboid family serine protease
MAWSDRRPIYEPGWNPRPPRHGAVLWLIGIMVAVHVLREVLETSGVLDRESRQTITWFGLTLGGLAEGHLWQPATYAFVHAGIWSLLWNMLLLLVAGWFYEAFAGARRLFELFGVCVLGASLSVVLRRTPTPLSGAAGATWGIVTALLLRAPDYPIRTPLFVIPLKAVVFLAAGIEVCLTLAGGTTASKLLPDATYDSLWAPVFGSATALISVWAWPRIARPKLRSLRRRAARRREMEEAQRRIDDERELDRILEKINREGLASLSPKERHFLQRASNRYQGSRET